MIKGILLVICTFFTSQQLFSQQALVFDTSKVEVRIFNTGKLREFKNNRDFQYDRVLEPPASLWDRFWSWFWNKIDEMLSTETGKRTFSTIMIVIAAAVLVYTIMKITGMSGAGLFRSKNTGAGIPYTTLDEDIHAISFEEAIERAVNEGNLRLAVRLLYLQTLKKLSDRGLINWQINKTNIAYVQELAGTTYGQSFNQLTLKFETNWYGDRHIEPEAFRQVRDEFNMFNHQLH
jgi:hypothetical protein